jgi:hypothetical protein
VIRAVLLGLACAVGGGGRRTAEPVPRNIDGGDGTYAKCIQAPM